MSSLDARPILLVVSGPSGAGKGTALGLIVQRLGVQRATTYTTRAPRTGEVDGVEYNFVSEDKFFHLFEQGVISEYTRTYSDSLYGSPSTLQSGEGPSVLAVEMDPTGFVRVRTAAARRVVGIFVTVDSEDELRNRIISRGWAADDMEKRMRVRTDQLTWAWTYDYLLVNRDRDEFSAQLGVVVQAETLKMEGARRMLGMRQAGEQISAGSGRF